MKKLIFIFIILAITLSNYVRPSQAQAIQSQYAMVVTENACFYSDASRQFVKFNLPYSYFVKIVSIGIDYTRVVYMDDSASHPSSEGYVSNIDLNFTISPTSSPYPNLTLVVKTDDVLFSDTAKTQPKTVVSAGQDAFYYGKLTVGGENYLYVYSAGYIGYIRESCFYIYELPNHPNAYLLEKSNSSDSEPVEDPPSSNISFLNFQKPVQLAIVAIMIMASLCLIYFVLRPDKKPSHEHSFFNDKDDFF